MIIRCCEVSDIAARPPHAVQLAKEDVSHSAFGIIRTAVKMRVDRGIRFLGREEIEHLDFPSWISSRVQRKLGICSRQAGRRKSGRRGRSGPDPHARRAPARGRAGVQGARPHTTNQPSLPQLRWAVSQNYSLLPVLLSRLLNQRAESNRKSGRTHGRGRKVERTAEYSPRVTRKTTCSC